MFFFSFPARSDICWRKPPRDRLVNCFIISLLSVSLPSSLPTIKKHALLVLSHFLRVSTVVGEILRTTVSENCSELAH
jgi:hypothetical protein